MKRGILGVVVFMISLGIFTIDVFAFTTHEFKVSNNSGTILIDSFPDKYNDIPLPDFPHALLCYTREKGKWDDYPIPAGKSDCTFTEEKTKRIMCNIKAIQKALDDVFDPSVLVSFSYILCYEDAVICINDDNIPEELKMSYHESICTALNILREQFISGSSTH